MNTIYVGNLATDEYTIRQWKAAAENLPSVVEADAALISELRAENARLREALEAAVLNIDYEKGCASWADHKALLIQARAALKGAE